MWFNYSVLITALTISGVAAYYSIIGLTAIFAAAFWPIVVMGSTLEVGKIITSVWLKRYWHRANWKLKSYLTFAVAVLMLITSMGIFGFLSKAHMDQGVPTGDIAAKVSIIDEKIKTERDNIDTARKALTQMDAQVDQRLSRGDSESGAERAVQIRRAQAKERSTLQSDIALAQKTIARLNEEKAPIASELRKVEAEVGPIKYIAALVYGDNLDQNILERAVRWVIIILVLVFDPLAIALILAANSSIRWEDEDAEYKNQKGTAPVQSTTSDEKTPAANDTQDSNLEEINREINSLPDQIEDQVELPPEQRPFNLTDYPYLTKPFKSLTGLKPVVYTSEPAEPVVAEPTPEPTPTPVVEPVVPQVRATAKRFKAPIPVVPETRNVRRTVALQADNVEPQSTKSSFGLKFPDSAIKGELFLRVDYLPNKLFKYNGDKWIEVDKAHTDSYTNNEQYISFLVDKLKSGEYELDQLSDTERELVTNKLNELLNEQTKNINTTTNT